MIQGTGRCQYHPERPGLGVCVECRRVICQECTTQFEGINRCARCLQKRLAAQKDVGIRQEWSAGSVFLALFGFAVVFGCVYLAAYLTVEG